jgi:outer membrane biosynthesis protein TonB
MAMEPEALREKVEHLEQVLSERRPLPKAKPKPKAKAKPSAKPQPRPVGGKAKEKQKHNGVRAFFHVNENGKATMIVVDGEGRVYL